MTESHPVKIKPTHPATASSSEKRDVSCRSRGYGTRLAWIDHDRLKIKSKHKTRPLSDVTDRPATVANRRACTSGDTRYVRSEKGPLKGPLKAAGCLPGARSYLTRLPPNLLPRASGGRKTGGVGCQCRHGCQDFGEQGDARMPLACVAEKRKGGARKSSHSRLRTEPPPTTKAGPTAKAQSPRHCKKSVRPQQGGV